MSANLDPEHLAVITTTISKYAKGAEDATIRQRKLTSYIKKRGNIKYGQSGTSLTWQVEYSQPQMRQMGDAGEITFAEHNAFKQATLDWRGYVITDQMTEKQKEINKGPEALINLFGTKTQRMIKKFNDGLNAEFYVDGNATGNENRLHGFGSCTGAANTAAGNLIATPNDTYAGLVTNLANYGGTWSANRTTAESPRYPNATLAKDWPWGSGTSEYDFWAPKLVNASSTAWGTGGSTYFKDNCEQIIRRTNLWLLSTGNGGSPAFFFGPDWYGDIMTYYSAKQRIMVPHKETEDLGFAGESINIDGTGIVFDFDCPAQCGYGLKLDDIELHSLYSGLFNVRGPEFDIQTNSYLTRLGFFGNLKFNPKNVAKITSQA